MDFDRVYEGGAYQFQGGCGFGGVFLAIMQGLWCVYATLLRKIGDCTP